MKKILFILLTSFLCIGYVLAEEPIEEPVEEEVVEEENLYISGSSCQMIDVSNVTYTITHDDFGYNVKFSNVNSLLPSGSINGFYSFIGEIYSGIIYIPIAGGGFRWNELQNLSKSGDTWIAYLPNEWISKEGKYDITLSFEKSDTLCYYANKSITIEKPGVDIPSLKDRYEISFHQTKRQISVQSKSSFGADDLTIEIGAIRDTSLLNDLKNNVSGVYDNLLTYAKNNTGSFISYENPYNMENVYKNFEIYIVKDAIYYAYIKNNNKANSDGIIVIQGLNDNKLTTSVNYNNAVIPPAGYGYVSYSPTSDMCYDVSIANKVDFNFTYSGGKYYMVFSNIDNLIQGKTIDEVYVSFGGNYHVPGAEYHTPSGGNFFWSETHLLTRKFGAAYALAVPGYWVIGTGNNQATMTFIINDDCYASKSPLVINRPTKNYGSGLGKKYNIGLNDLNKQITISGNTVYDFGYYDFKIGTIKDVDLIDSLKNKQSNSLSDLLDYSQNDTGLFSTKYYKSPGQQPPSYDFDVEKNGLYYVYIYNDDYYGSHDVYVVQGTDSDIPLLTTNVDYSKLAGANYAVDPDEQPNSEPGSTTDNEDIGNQKGSNNPDALDTVANPSTGLSIGIISICVLIILFVTIHKFNNRKIFKI